MCDLSVGWKWPSQILFRFTSTILLPPPQNYLGPQSSEPKSCTVRNFNLLDLSLLWHPPYVSTYVWPHSRQPDPDSRRQPSPPLWRWRKDLDYSPSPLSWPTFHTDPGHNSQKKMEGKCISPRSQVILPWLANSPKQPIRPQQWGLSSITLIPVTLPLRGVWENWNIRKYLLD